MQFKLVSRPWLSDPQALQSDSFSSEMSGNATIGHKLILTLVKFIGGLQRNSNSNSSLLEQFSFIQPLKLPICFTGSMTNRVGRVLHYFNLYGVDKKTTVTVEKKNRQKTKSLNKLNKTKQNKNKTRQAKQQKKKTTTPNRTQTRQKKTKQNKTKKNTQKSKHKKNMIKQNNKGKNIVKTYQLFIFENSSFNIRDKLWWKNRKWGA